MTSSSKVRFVSSIIAVSDPVMGEPAAAKSSGSTTCSSLDIRSRPSASARRSRRVDGQAEDAPPALRRGNAERRGRRRLAHAARADGDEHATRHHELVERLGGIGEDAL